jgi:hypothetical protein
VPALALSLRRGNQTAAAGSHVRLPTSPSTRAAAAPEKARPQRKTVAATTRIKWPGPLPSKDDPRAARAPGSKNLTLEGCDYRPVASKPAQRGRAPQVPSIYKILLISGSRAARPRTLETCRCEKTGAPSCHPATALLIRVRNLILEGFKQVPQITRVRDDEGARIRAFPRAYRLESTPHVVFESQRRQLVGGSHRGRASAPSVPSEQDRAPPSKPTQAL